MSSAQQYKATMDSTGRPWMMRCPDGGFVPYAEHLEELAAKDAELETVRQIARNALLPVKCNSDLCYQQKRWHYALRRIAGDGDDGEFSPAEREMMRLTIENAEMRADHAAAIQGNHDIWQAEIADQQETIDKLRAELERVRRECVDAIHSRDKWHGLVATIRKVANVALERDDIGRDDALRRIAGDVE